MPRNDITSAFGALLAERITDFLYLVQVQGTQTLRWNNSPEVITYLSVPWVPLAFDVQGLSFKPDADPSATLVIPNTDGAAGALFLNEPMADAIVDIYQFSPRALADGDAPKLARMVFGRSTIDPDKLSAPLVSYSSLYQFSPRRRVDSYNGFNSALPPGTKLSWENMTINLAADDSNG